MSAQIRKSSLDSYKLNSDRAYSIIRRQLPPLPQIGRFSYSFGGHRRRGHDYMLTMRTQRPIQSHLVTHRRRFTTGHKHKQPYIQ